MKTVAEQIGQTPHLSPLLRRLRSMGLDTSESMRRLAVARGCFHYAMPGDELSPPPKIGRDRVSDAELVMGLICASQEFNPIYVRCAAQLLGSEYLDRREAVRLAVQERAVLLLRYIANAALADDAAERREEWRGLLDALPPAAEVAEGRLPHRSRFISATGIVMKAGRLDTQGKRIWLRPRSNPR